MLLGLALVVGGGFCIALGPGWEPGERSRATVTAIAQSACLATKVFALAFFFIWVRWTLPRFRYDHVMRLGWKQRLARALANLAATAGLLALGDHLGGASS